MKVKIIKSSFWFQEGQIYDIDRDVAKQLIALNDAEPVEEKEKPRYSETKLNETAQKREKKLPKP